VIRSFADKRTAALFAGYFVKALPNDIQPRARAKLLALDGAKRTICEVLPAIVSKRYAAIGAASTVSASTTNGGSASNGGMAQPGKSKWWTITRDSQ
jgi:plasmid maintenance system killer protein